MDLISVIIPAYNIEKYLERCIESILHQTYKDLQIIIIDDGSTDKTGEICNRYKEKDQRIIIIHKKNAGLGFARNSGLEIATGSYIVFIDGDDYVGPRHIEKMYEMVKRTGADTCIGGYTKVHSHHNTEHVNPCAGKCFFDNPAKEILPRMCGADDRGKDFLEMSVWRVLFSNSIIKKHNLRFVSERDLISEDIVFDFSYYPHSKGVCCGNMVDYYYCDNEGSLTTRYRADRFLSQVKLYGAIKEKAESIGIRDLCIPRMNTTLISIARYSIKLEVKFSKDNGEKESKQNIRDICSNSLLEDVLSVYDDRRIKKSSRVVNYLIKNKMYFLLEIAMKFKNAFNI